MRKLAIHTLALCSIAAASVVAYLPAVHNSFISDDFGIFPFLKALEQNPSYIFDATSELFRLTSYLYFEALFKLFGSTPEPYYLTGTILKFIIASFKSHILKYQQATGNTDGQPQNSQRENSYCNQDFDQSETIIFSALHFPSPNP
jgi:hypothetical protein